MSNLLRQFGLLASLIPTLLTCGCFQAENPFYRNSDITTDKRFEGRFVSNTANTNSDHSEFGVIEPAEDRHYKLTYHEDDKWIELDAVLFKCGTNVFVDISRITDNGVNSRPAVGPSGIEVLRLATIYRTHSVIRLRFVDDGIQVGCADGNPVYFALQKHPELEFKKSTPDQPIDPHMKILANSTEDLHRLLLVEGNNNSVFGFKSTLIKSEK